MRKWRLWIVLTVLCSLLSGCWSSVPIEELNMQIGVALDSAEESGGEEVANPEGGSHKKPEKIISTYQFTIPQGSGGAVMKSSASSSSSSFKNYYNMSETSDSIFEAMRQLSLRTRRTPIGHHLKVIVISEKLARSNNLTKIIDFFTRDNDIRPSVMLFVSKGMAKDVLENALPGQTPAFVLEGIFNNRDRNMGIWEPVSLAKVVGPLQGKKSFLLQNVIPIDQETKLSGAGVINGETGKLVGFLDESELEGMAWLTGKGLGGVLKTYNPDTNDLLTYEVKTMHSKIKANVNNGQISFNVKITSTGRYAEVFAEKSKKLHDGIVKKDKALLQKRVLEMVQTTVTKMQKELHTEAAGFGTSLHNQHPAVWRSVKDNWDETFSQIPITYEVNVNIEEYGASDTTAE
ncbi:Ger(x)C family spore germination protein [Paenibacillus sp. FSL H8-0261]|uniref:Ger(x)C family spore germination protein n=1 Tax=Paenibacillus sp. FSL H8-0261 TaxID=2921381 RepID=UPI00324E1936